MARAFVVCGLALILIAHAYLFTIAPYAPPEVEGTARMDEETQLFAFTMYLISVMGFLLVQLAALPLVDVRGRGWDVEEEIEEAGDAMDTPRVAPCGEARRGRGR